MNPNNKKCDYKWMYDTTRKSFVPRRKLIITIYIIVVILVLSVTIYNSVRGNIPSDQATFYLLVFIYISAIPFFAAISLSESDAKNKEIEKCLDTLNEHKSDINLNAVEKFERRAAADIGAARVFLLLPGLIVTFLAPVFFSSFANVDLGETDSPMNNLNQLAETPNFILLLIVFLVPSFLYLYFQLERANVSSVIQHACIERAAEIESQDTPLDGREDGGKEEGINVGGEISIRVDTKSNGNITIDLNAER